MNYRLNLIKVQIIAMGFSIYLAIAFSSQNIGFIWTYYNKIGHLFAPLSVELLKTWIQ